jgi:putative Mg2+ transporter-C (MgtC) family protein
MRHGSNVFGITTAATLWLSAAIGMTCGVGMYDLAALATISSVAVLSLIRIVERKLLPSSIKKARRYKISVYCFQEDRSRLHRELQRRKRLF